MAPGGRTQSPPTGAPPPTWHTHGASCRLSGRLRGRARGAAYHERCVRCIARLRDGAQLRCSGQCGRSEGEERSCAGRPTARARHRQRPQRLQRCPRPRCPVRGPFSEHQRCCGSRACRDTQARTSVSPAVYSILTLTTLWRSCRALPGVWVPLSLGTEEIGAPAPVPRSQPSLRGRLPPSSIRKDLHYGLPSLKVTKASTSPSPYFPVPRAHTHVSVGVFVDEPLFEPARWGPAATKPGGPSARWPSRCSQDSWACHQLSCCPGNLHIPSAVSTTSPGATGAAGQRRDSVGEHCVGI